MGRILSWALVIAVDEENAMSRVRRPGDRLSRVSPIELKGTFEGTFGINRGATAPKPDVDAGVPPSAVRLEEGVADRVRDPPTPLLPPVLVLA